MENDRGLEMMKCDVEEVVFIICIFLAIALTVGDPDILDGLIKMANR